MFLDVSIVLNPFHQMFYTFIQLYYFEIVGTIVKLSTCIVKSLLKRLNLDLKLLKTFIYITKCVPCI